MAVRTSDAAIRLLVALPTTAVLTPFVTMANLLVEKVAEKGILTEAELTAIEDMLGAHFASLRYDMDTSMTKDTATVNVRKSSGSGLKATFWGQQAIAMDSTGTLLTLDQSKTQASITFLGSDDV